MKPSTFIVLLAIVVASRDVQADEMGTGKANGDARHQLLVSPFAVPRANYFYTALEVPEFDSARTLERGRVYARLRTAHALSSNERTISGYENKFDGLYHEWAGLEVDWGAMDRLELGLRTAWGGWDEHIDKFKVRDRNGNYIVRDEGQNSATSRHENMTVVSLRAKALLLKAEDAGFDFSLAPSLKIPVSRAGDLTSAGTYDVACTLLASVPLRRVVLHANLGATFPLGEQDLFESDADVTLDPFVYGAVGATLPLPADFAVGIQLEANSSAFGDVKFLEDPPANVVAGVRKLFGNVVVEAGGGTGLDWGSSYKYMYFFSVGYLF